MNLLLYGDTETSSDLFHALPTGIADPFLYVDAGGRRVALISRLDQPSVRAADPFVETLDPMAFGWKDLVRSGMPRTQAGFEVARRALAELDVWAAIVPWQFPVALADVLRENGVELTVDGDAFARRRRIKTETQLAGIRRAQAAADAAMVRARDLIHACAEGLTAEAVRTAMQETAAAHGCVLADDVVVGPNEQGAAGHDPGSGPIAPGDGVIVDIWPRDPQSRCWADMTRTFVAGGGEPDAELAIYWELCREALARVTEAVRPGANGAELNDLASEIFEAAGQPTARSADGPLVDGFFHGLGHGVGLDVHEAPGLGLAGGQDLVAGDVIAVEPGCYRHDYGGVRLEDLLLVTAGGCEVLTQFPYEL